MKTYLCTRSQLAALLQKSGHATTVTVNPWHPHYMAWEFDVTPELSETVKAYYVGIGKPIPRCFIEQEAHHGN